MKKYFFTTLFTIFISSLLLSTSFSDGQHVTFLGVNNNYPYLYFDVDGNASGIIVEILEEIAIKESLKIKYELVNPYKLSQYISLYSPDIVFHGNHLEFTDITFFYETTVPFITVRNHIFSLDNKNNILSINPLTETEALIDIFNQKNIGIKNVNLHRKKCWNLEKKILFTILITLQKVSVSLFQKS